MSSVAMLEDRPPLIECFTEAVEDRTASIAEGHYVGKDVIFFRVTEVGGKATFEPVAEDHLRNLRGRDDRLLPMYEAVYKAFKEGVEPPVSGTSLRDWPGITPAQLKMCISCNIRSIEDLATLPENGIQHLGMGARALQQKAMLWLEAANGTGKLAERLAAMEVREADRVAEMARKDEEISALQAKLAAKEGPRETIRHRSRESRDVNLGADAA